MNALTPISRIFSGGTIEVTPGLTALPGSLIAGINYESVLAGYRRIDGFERFDGRAKPSSASYSILKFKTGAAPILAGQTVTGATSGATALALFDAIVTAGAYGGAAAGYLVLWTVAGTFQDGENLQVGGLTKMVADGTQAVNAATTDALDATYLQAAIEATRALILIVPGSGKILGAWSYNGTTYAFRNNAGATQSVMWKSTAAGWVQVALGSYLAFTAGGGGAYTVLEGDAVVAPGSGATGTIQRITTTSGAWDGSKVGTFILSAITGAFVNGENLTINGHVAAAKASGSQVAITLNPSGSYEFRNYNFYGRTAKFRMYGADGVNKAFEFDGTYYVPIPTGMTADTPNHLAVHNKLLFLSFPGGSIQYSSIGEPTQWLVVLGAGELGIGDDCTGMLASVTGISVYQPSGVLLILAKASVWVLMGHDALDFQLEEYSFDSGAVSGTAQYVGEAMFVDNRGLRKLSSTKAFGDSKFGTLSLSIERTMIAKKAAGVTIVGSVRVRSKGQYRLFYSDGTGITFYFGRKNPEAIAFDLGKVVTSVCSSEDANGNEVLFFGSTDGYVYQLDSGTSFDGGAVTAYCKFAFDHCGSPRYNKRFSHVVFETDASPSAALKFVTETSYGDVEEPMTPEQSATVQGGGGFWNESQWNDFYWSSPVYGLATADLDTEGTNLGITILSTATYEKPHTLQGYSIYYSRRGLAL